MIGSSNETTKGRGDPQNNKAGGMQPPEKRGLMK